LGRQVIINPGSVGNAFLKPFTPGLAPLLLPWAEYATVNVEKGQWSVSLHRVQFDTQEILRLAKISDSPSRDWRLDLYYQD
jgi:hypothetical protein